jgi:hypothetical protein
MRKAKRQNKMAPWRDQRESAPDSSNEQERRLRSSTAHQKSAGKLLLANVRFV